MNDSVSNCNCSAELNESMEHGNAQEMIQIEQDVEVMSEIETGFLTWLKAHKKQLIMAGVGITTAIVVFIRHTNGRDVRSDMKVGTMRRQIEKGIF